MASEKDRNSGIGMAKGASLEERTGTIGKTEGVPLKGLEGIPPLERAWTSLEWQRLPCGRVE